MKLYLRNILVGLDQMFNAIFGGDPDETMSSRVYRYKDKNWCARVVYKCLNWIDPQHCEQSLEPEQNHKNDVLK